MNYLEMIRQKNSERLALIHDGSSYTYGELADHAEQLSQNREIFPESFKAGMDGKRLHIIQREKILDQLLEFLACSKRNLIPMIVPYDAKLLPENIMVPNNVCMAVMTSGTSGKPKVLFRTYESWADFFPVQNEIFEIKENSRLFVQGSLAFTGNLNLYLAQFFAGAAIIAENTFAPAQWITVIEREKIDVIYLIPSKLMCLLWVLEKREKKEYYHVKMILSGSQGFSGEDAKRLKQYFPQAEILYYYGASELSYLTYIRDKDMTREKNLVGKPFPNVRVFVQQGKIFVDTPYHAEGISCPCTISDRGYLDENENLYFHGRSDDIIEIHGRKISAVYVENVLELMEEVEEAAVLLFIENNRQVLTAFAVFKEDVQIELLKYIGQGRFLGKVKWKKYFQQLKSYLAGYEMPNRIIAVQKMPRNDSGKIEKKKLKQEWESFGISCIQ